jgi:hypothetical protein
VLSSSIGCCSARVGRALKHHMEEENHYTSRSSSWSMSSFQPLRSRIGLCVCLVLCLDVCMGLDMLARLGGRNVDGWAWRDGLGVRESDGKEGRPRMALVWCGFRATGAGANQHHEAGCGGYPYVCIYALPLDTWRPAYVYVFMAWQLGAACGCRIHIVGPMWHLQRPLCAS